MPKKQCNCIETHHLFVETPQELNSRATGGLFRLVHLHGYVSGEAEWTLKFFTL